MKAMFFVRLIIIGYLLGLGIIIFHALSEFFFGEKPWKTKAKIVLKKLFFAPFYPLSLLSKQGRVSFINKIKNI